MPRAKKGVEKIGCSMEQILGKASSAKKTKRVAPPSCKECKRFLPMKKTCKKKDKVSPCE